MHSIIDGGKVLLDQSFGFLPIEDASCAIGNRAHVVERQMRNTVFKHASHDGRRQNLAMSDNSIAQAFHLVDGHVRIGP